MGKGDKRSRKGKRIAGSYGVYRPRTAKNAYVSNGEPKAKKTAKKVVEKKVAKKKTAPVKEVVVEEVAVAEAPVVEAKVEEIASETAVVEKAPKKETKPATKKAAKKGDKDDLKKIEGIGPATEKVFNEAGITTYAELAAAKVDALKEILAAKGSRYKLLVPDTWPEQSALAADDKWDDLKKLQDTLDKGKRKS